MRRIFPEDYERACAALETDPSATVEDVEDLLAALRTRSRVIYRLLAEARAEDYEAGERWRGSLIYREALGWRDLAERTGAQVRALERDVQFWSALDARLMRLVNALRKARGEVVW